MSETSEDQVQDNVIVVPFQLLDEVYNSYNAGWDLKAIAVAAGADEHVVRAIVKLKKRNSLRQKYMGPTNKEPA